MWLRLLSVVRRYRVALGVVGAVVALGLSVNAWVTHVADAAYTQGANDVLNDARATVAEAQAQATRLQERLAQAVHRTDTVFVRVAKSQTKFEDAVAALPDSVRDLPGVKEVINSGSQLSEDVTELMRVRLTERFLTDTIFRIDSLVALPNQMLLNQAIRERDSRPRWHTVWKIVTVTAATGVAVGKFILKED